MDEEGAEVFDDEDGAPGDLGTWWGVVNLLWRRGDEDE